MTVCLREIYGDLMKLQMDTKNKIMGFHATAVDYRGNRLGLHTAAWRTDDNCMVMLRHHAGEQIDGGWEQLHGDLLVAVR
jgi:hypothetical protein